MNDSNPIGPIVLPLNVAGRPVEFQLRLYQFDGQRWVAVSRGKPAPGEPMPLRIESACLFGHVFHSMKCDCDFQLGEAFQRIAERDRGLVIFAVDQDARGLGIEAHFRIYVMRQVENLDTDAVYERLGAPVDARTYEPVIAILRDLGIDSVLLLSNNRQRREFLAANGIHVTNEAIEASLTVQNMSTLMLEKEDLRYDWSFATHGDWLAPLQAIVAGRSDARAGAIVDGLTTEVARYTSDDGWSVARPLVRALAERPRSPIVYLTDLPRVDELPVYASIGALFVVVPFAVIPPWLRDAAARAGVRMQDWERANRYETPRPQWELAAVRGGLDVYRRDGATRCVGNAAEVKALAAALEESGRAAEVVLLDDEPSWVGFEGVEPEAAARPAPRVRPVPRASGGNGAALEVDTADIAPPPMKRFVSLNPFHFDPQTRIPVAGSSEAACSIESVWQGLKLFDGRHEPAMFTRPPWKRPAAHEAASDYAYPRTRFLFGTSDVDLVTARWIIYLPTYLWALEHLMPEAVATEIGAKVASGGEVVFYDVDDNFDIDDPSRSFSHSAILASWFGGTLEETFLEPFARRFGGSYGVDLDALTRRYRRWKERYA